MAEKDFIVEKQRIITAIEEIDRKLAEIKDDDTEGPLADEEFIEKASYFIMVSKLLELFQLTNTARYALCAAGTFAVFGGIYILVYALTARAYHRIVA